jgi:hypothetical protein
MATTVYEPAVHRLNIYHGENFQLHFGYYNPDASGNPDYTAPIDLTGCEAEFKVWEPSTDNVLLVVDSATSSDIVLGGTAGTIDINIPAATVNAIQTTEEAAIPEYRWSFQVTFPDGTEDIWIYGPCFVIESWVPSA